MPRTWRTVPWTPRQRSVLLALLLCLLTLLSYRYLTRPTYVPTPLPDATPRADDLISTLDPNQATWSQIALLPGLGEKRAKAIVAYRDQYHTDHPNDIPFRTPADLTHIKGIGDKTAATLAPYLSFPSPDDQH